jgi:hypothetical protein
MPDLITVLDLDPVALVQTYLVWLDTQVPADHRYFAVRSFDVFGAPNTMIVVDREHELGGPAVLDVAPYSFRDTDSPNHCAQRDDAAAMAALIRSGGKGGCFSFNGVTIAMVDGDVLPNVRKRAMA